MPTNPRIEAKRCAVCGKKSIRVRHMTRSYGRGTALLVIENVPVMVCPDCGESYMTAETLRQLDRIKSRRRRAAGKRPVAEYV